MTHPDTVYSGHRVTDRHGVFTGVVVLVGTERLTLPASLGAMYGRFEWGYGGLAAARLALALVYDATGDRALAVRAYTWFKWAKVAAWGERWRITAGEIRRWVDQCLREDPDAVELEIPVPPPPVYGCVRVRRCRECGCTEDDCRGCIAAAGYPCSWSAADPTVCTRCAAELPALVAAEGGAA